MQGFFFFSVNMHSALPIPGISSAESTNRGSKTVFLMDSWESVNAEGLVYALIYTILCKGPRFGYLWEVLESITPQIPRDN